MSTTPSFFNVTSGTQKSIETPPGTIVPYLGTTDPDGWVICDGSQRIYDSKYDELVSLSYGTKSDSGTYYYPINLQNTFLRGGTDNLGSVIGDGTLKIPLIEHYHDVTYNDSSSTSHKHTYDVSIYHSHGLTLNDSHSHNLNSITFDDHQHHFDMPMPQHQHGILLAGDDFNYKGGTYITNQPGGDANGPTTGSWIGEWMGATGGVMSTWDNNYNQGYQPNGEIMNPSGDGSASNSGYGTSGGLWKDLKGNTDDNTDYTLYLNDNDADSVSIDNDSVSVAVDVKNETIDFTFNIETIDSESIELNPSNYTVVFIMKL
jgi:hypothetical protein